MTEKEFIEEVAKMGINISDEQLQKLDNFYNLLISWNEKINLTRIVDRREVYLKHFYDSLTLARIVDLREDLSICDVGSGAGFPGIVLKIVFPNLKIVLIDALEKRVRYLNEIIKELELENIEAKHTRCEEYARKNYERFDIVTARAVAHLRILTELCVPMVKIDGYFVAMKANVLEEINESQETLNSLKSTIEVVDKFNLPIEGSLRNLVKIRKIAKTNRKYPRNFNKIKNFN